MRIFLQTENHMCTFQIKTILDFDSSMISSETGLVFISQTEVCMPQSLSQA